MSNFVTIMNNPALNTMHTSKNANIGVIGMALNTRKVDVSADKSIKQTALTLSGYPEYITGSGSTATTRNTTKYNYDAIIINE